VISRGRGELKTEIFLIFTRLIVVGTIVKSFEDCKEILQKVVGLWIVRYGEDWGGNEMQNGAKVVFLSRNDVKKRSFH